LCRYKRALRMHVYLSYRKSISIAMFLAYNNVQKQESETRIISVGHMRSETNKRLCNRKYVLQNKLRIYTRIRGRYVFTLNRSTANRVYSIGNSTDRIRAACQHTAPTRLHGYTSRAIPLWCHAPAPKYRLSVRLSVCRPVSLAPC